MEEKQQNRLLYCVLFAFLVSGAASQPLGSFIPFLRETYGFSYDLSGILLSCQSVGNLIATVVSGLLPGLLGRRRSILALAVWMPAAYLIMLSGLGAPVFMMSAFFMTGIARGANANFSNTMISTLPREKAARGYNLSHGFFAIGALLSPLALVAFARRWPAAGWRMMAGLLMVFCLAQLAVYVKMPLPPEPDRKAGRRAVDRSFLHVRQFWLGGLVLFFYISTEYAIVGWLVTYFQDAGILTADQSQMMNSLLWLVIFLGRMFGAATTGKLSRTKLMTVDGFGVFAFFMVLFFSRTPGPVVVGLIGTGLFMATIYPSAFALGSECIRGNDFGCSILVLTGSAGGILAPALVGFAAERAGIRAGMALVMAFNGLLLASILLCVFSFHHIMKKGVSQHGKA